MKSKKKPAKFISAREAARRIGRSHSAIADWVKQDKIPGAVKIGRTILIPTAWIDNLSPEDFLR